MSGNKSILGSLYKNYYRSEEELIVEYLAHKQGSLVRDIVMNTLKEKYGLTIDQAKDKYPKLFM